MDLFFCITLIGLAICLIIVILYKDINKQYKFASFEQFRSIVDRSRYFDSLNAADLKKRSCQTSHEYKNRYIKSFRYFTDAEKTRLAKLTDTALALLPLSISENVRWIYAKIGDDIELGLPHTLGDELSIIVCLSNNPLDLLDHELLEIICHEIVHVYQRLYELRYINIVKSLGFLPYISDINPYCGYIKASNPDTWGLYSYNSNVFLSVYDDALENTNAIYNIKSGKIQLMGGMDGNVIQLDHPYEIVACIIAKIALGRTDELGDYAGWATQLSNI